MTLIISAEKKLYKEENVSKENKNQFLSLQTADSSAW